MAPRVTLISPDNLCSICGKCTVKSQIRNVCDFAQEFYFPYFKLRAGDKNKPWAPHKVCRRCEEEYVLSFRVKYKKIGFRFSIYMMWHQQNPTSNWYYV